MKPKEGKNNIFIHEFFRYNFLLSRFIQLHICFQILLKLSINERKAPCEKIIVFGPITSCDRDLMIAVVLVSVMMNKKKYIYIYKKGAGGGGRWAKGGGGGGRFQMEINRYKCKSPNKMQAPVYNDSKRRKSSYPAKVISSLFNRSRSSRKQQLVYV